jgi:hypothetical protein
MNTVAAINNDGSWFCFMSDGIMNILFNTTTINPTIDTIIDTTVDTNMIIFLMILEFKLKIIKETQYCVLVKNLKN